MTLTILKLDISEWIQIVAIEFQGHLTIISLESFLWDIDKQYKTRSECWSGSALFAYRIYF